MFLNNTGKYRPDRSEKQDNQIIDTNKYITIKQIHEIIKTF